MAALQRAAYLLVVVNVRTVCTYVSVFDVRGDVQVTHFKVNGLPLNHISDALIGRLLR